MPVLTADLAFDNSSAATSRSLVRDALAAASKRDPQTADVAALLTGELVMNAVKYAAPPLSLEVTFDGTVTVAVLDGGPGIPLRAERTPDVGENGWGLVLVDEMADHWGYEFLDGSKRVWFQLD